MQDACEPLNRDQTRVNGIANPAVELARIAAAKDSAEAHAKAAHQSELRRALFQGIDLSRLTDRQHASRLHTEGSCDYRRDHMAGLRIAYGDNTAAR